MWICEFLKEWWNWLREYSYYGIDLYRHKKRMNYIYLFMTVAAIVACFALNGDDNIEFYVIRIQFMYALIFDLILYVIRIYLLWKGPKEPNPIKLFHSIIHINIVNIWIQGMVYVWINTQASSKMLLFIIPILSLRVLVYGIYTIIIIILLPYIIYVIVKQGRTRLATNLYLSNINYPNPNREQLLRQYNDFRRFREEIENMRQNNNQEYIDNLRERMNI